MKNLLVTLAAVLVAGAAAASGFYLSGRNTDLAQAAREGNAMAWLRLEFKLTEPQYAAIEKLHEDYRAVCAQHCSEITAARKRLAPAAEIAALEATCVKSMTEHFRRVAALMPPGQGDRYLATVLPRVDDYDHSKAADLQALPH